MLEWLSWLGAEEAGAWVAWNRWQRPCKDFRVEVGREREENETQVRAGRRADRRSPPHQAQGLWGLSCLRLGCHAGWC